MTTETHLYFRDASQMQEVDDASVDLVVTSPPYPMIEMWDGLFFDIEPTIEAQFNAGKYRLAFEKMHEALRAVWKECYRVLKRGGMLCLNIGDAIRTLDGDFQLYPNHAQTTQQCLKVGFSQLPGILWRKSTNKPNKFMGSGMLAPNAYVTLEHEHILIFRKGEKRRVKRSRRNERYESAYFWEERNQWFSDVWMDLVGTSQVMNGAHKELRERSAAFPLDLPLRLVHMYSMYGDTVLDPFLGTGTTALAASMLGRNAIGYEVDAVFQPLIEKKLHRAASLSRKYSRQRIEEHLRFLRRRDKPCKNYNPFYDFDVITRQEQHIKLYDVSNVVRPEENKYSFSYEPHLIQKEMFATSHHPA